MNLQRACGVINILRSPNFKTFPQFPIFTDKICLARTFSALPPPRSTTQSVSWKQLPYGRSISTQALPFKEGIFRRVITRCRTYFRKHKLRAAGFHLYESIADQLDYSSVIKVLHLPDTFNSWFMLTELHVWMILSRIMADPVEGRVIRNFIVEALWADVSTRSKKLGNENASIIRDQIHEMNEEFQAALISYDEGAMSEDRVLASALWRRLFSRDCVDVHCLEAVVKYVRMTMYSLDAVPIEKLIEKPKVTWTSVDKIIKEIEKYK